MNIVKRSQNDHAMKHLLRTPFDEMIERFFNFPAEAGGYAHWLATDIAEDDDQFTVTAEVPGMKKDQIDISVTDNLLTISGEKLEEHEDRKGQNVYHVERRYGRFHRDVQLPTPVDADKVSASYEDGVLKISLPKSEKARARRISVK